MRKLSTYIVSSLALGLLAPLPLQAASIVAADDGGYAGRVIEKVGQVWTPPPGLRGNFSVRIRITVGEDGKVRECRATEPSVLKAFDDAACGAVHNASPFGKTPEGKPVDVHMAFRIGAPKKAPRELTFEEAARESAKERERLDNLIANEKAGFVESRARERAEAMAKKLGVALSDFDQAPLQTSKPMLPPPPQTSAKPEKTEKTEKTVKFQKKVTVADKSDGGVLIGSTNKNKGPELVIKSNLKHLDAALEAQSEATAEAQAPAPSANSPITIVTPQAPKAKAPATAKEQPAPESKKVVVIPQQQTGGYDVLSEDELAVPPLETLVAEIELLPANEPTPQVEAPVAAPEQKDTDKVQTEQTEQKAKKREEPAPAAKAEEPKPGVVTPAVTKAPEVKKVEAKVAEPKESEPKVTEPRLPAPKAAEKSAPANMAPAEPLKELPVAKPKAATPEFAPVDENMSYADYLERIKKDIQQRIRLPQELRNARQIVSVQLYLSRTGRIRRSDLIHNSSNIRRDEALAEAIKQVGKVSPPPAALGQHFPLTIVFEAQ